jgi:methionyl-tRNA formyltransferase
MRLAFLGTPEPAVMSLRALVQAGHDIQIVVTRPDRRRGRGSATSPSPVKAAALELGLTVAHDLGAIDEVHVERGIVVAYGAMIPVSLLERVPMLNVHFSLLPRWRGAAPVERAILAGDEETGVCIMTLEEGLDTGPVHLERRVRVDDKTAAQLTEELAVIGAEALVDVLDSAALLANPVQQLGTATYASKLTSDTFHLQPSMTSLEVLRVVRLGRAFAMVHDRRLGVRRARAFTDARVDRGAIAQVDGVVAIGTLDGAVALEWVQPEGSSQMDARAWWSGARLTDGPRWT